MILLLVYCKAPVYCCLSNYVLLVYLRYFYPSLPMTSLNKNAKGAKEFYFVFLFFSRLLAAWASLITRLRWGANGTFECVPVSFSLWITNVSLGRNFGILASHTLTATLPIICFWATAHLCQRWPNSPQRHSGFNTFCVLLIIEDWIASLISLVMWFIWKESTQTDKLLNPLHKFRMFFFWQSWLEMVH